MSYDSLMMTYDVLLNAAGILFGILGLWVGIFYLETLKNSSEQEKYKQAVKQSNELLQPFFFSLLSFFITFSVVFSTPFFKTIEINEEFRIILKCLFAEGAAIIFWILVLQVIVSMQQVGIFQGAVSRNAAVSKMRYRLMLGKRVPKDDQKKVDKE